jgi:alpha-mannosidase
MKWKLGSNRLLLNRVSLAVVCLAAMPFHLLNAQTHRVQDQEIVDQLPPATRSVIERLGELNRFEANDWRYHLGDVPHGEAVDLNDADWQAATPSGDAPKEAVWYRRWIEIPKTFHGYDVTGMRIWFHFDAPAHGDVPQIVYFNGRRVALGADLEPIVLTESATPGERILVAVKLLQTAGPKRVNGAILRVDFPENRPNPGDVRDEVLSCQELIPTLSKNPAADQAVLAKAVAAIDVKALDTPGAAGQQRFDASLRVAQQQLEALKPLLQQATFHETGNSHIDAAWLWPWTETVDVVHRTFGTAAQLLNEYPKYTYTQSAAQYNEWMAEKYPELNDQIKKDIDAGRWEVLGGMWVEPDLNLPDGESLVRSILIGKRYFQKEYGVDVHIGWNPDSFGYNWQLPQIYKRSGIDTFVTQKMEWNDTNQLPFKLFWWESPDGSKVLTYFPHGYGNRTLNPVRLSVDLATARKQAPGLNELMDLYGVGDHGGGPTRSMLDEGMHWAQPDKIIPTMEFGTADAYFKKVRPEIAEDSKTWNYASIAGGYTYPAPAADGQISVPTWDDELYLEYHRGVYTTQAKHKQNMRDSEEQALNAEKYASLAWLDGNTYPADEFTDAWKKITFNDFHDLAAGSGIGVIYREAQKQFDAVRRETGEISEASLKTLAAQVDTRTTAGVPVLVWNPLAWERSGLVTVDVQMPEPASEVSVVNAEGKALPAQVLSSDAHTNSFKLLVRAENVPALGYAVVHVVPGRKAFASDVKADGLTIENDALRLTVDKQTGCITSLYDKRAGFETLASGGCGNELQAFTDKPQKYDAWNIDPGTLDVPPAKLDTAESVELIDHTPLRAVIRIKRKWQSSSFTQDIALYTGADHAVVSTDVDWRERHILLKAAFPLAATSNNATYEIPYGSIERPTTRNNSFEKGRFEVPALRWADEGDGQHGFSLINNSKYGYDGVGNLLRLSLLRSPTSPDPEADQGMQHFSYTLYPHAGDWKHARTVEHGYEFNYPLTATQVTAHAGTLPTTHSYVSVSSPNVILTAMKKAEDSDSLILRMYESAGETEQVRVTVPAGARQATLTNLMENEAGTSVPLSDGTATVSIHPYEILTLKVDYTR